MAGKNVFSLIVIMLLLTGSLNVLAVEDDTVTSSASSSGGSGATTSDQITATAEPQTDVRAEEGSLNREEALMRCIQRHINAYGVDHSKAKEKCLSLVRDAEGETKKYVEVSRRIIENEETTERPEDAWKRYSDPELDTAVSADVRIARPSVSYGSSLPKIEGYEEDFVGGWVFDRLHDNLRKTAGEEIEDSLEQYCGMANEDIVAQLKDKVAEVFREQDTVCAQLKEKAKSCSEDLEDRCSLSQPEEVVRLENGERYTIPKSYSCPADKGEIIEVCMKRMSAENRLRLANAEERCKREWEHNADYFEQRCENQNTLRCDKEDFLEGCRERQQIEPKPEEDCKDLWWFDSQQTECRLKNFCGAYMYRGLYTFENREECEKKLNVIIGEEQEVSEAEKLCREKGGEWKKFSDGCVDSCAKARDDSLMCTQALTYGCACGEDQCWNGRDCEPIRDEDGDENEDDTTDSGVITGKVVEDVEGNRIVSSSGSVEKDSYASATARETSCEERWEQQEQQCRKIESLCSQESFMETCIGRTKKDVENFERKAREICSRKAEQELDFAERHCSRIEEDRERCLERTKERCTGLKKAAESCVEMTRDDRIYEEIAEKIRRKCRLLEYETQEEEAYEDDSGDEGLKEVVLALSDDITRAELVELATLVQELQESTEVNGIKLYKGLIEPYSLDRLNNLTYVVDAKYNTARTIRRGDAGGEVAKLREEKSYVKREELENVLRRILSVRQNADVPEEYASLIERNAEDLVNVSDNLENIDKKEEEKNFGYKMRMFLGLAKKAEQEEIKEIEASKAQLESSIANLRDLMEDIPDLTAKATLQSQVETLEDQRKELDELIEKKEKKSRGWFSFLFG